ncbi:MAG: bifunctional 4-hydroxy-2-oxoglutarate aldolase/2-dehydro-3-deoxy-phosphogluconate aldolase [Acidobacteriota bacterium]
MDRSRILATIQAGRIIAILRGDFRGHETAIAEALVETGITALEVTLNSPGAAGSIELLAARFGHRMAVGAGTVLDCAGVEQAAGAGAQFIVSPNRDASVIEASRRHELISIPGCFTPSEVVEALAAGADAVKIFPASCIEPSYIGAILGPLPETRLVPTGGVTPERVTHFLKAGAWAVGSGSDLIGSDVLQPGGLERLRKRAAVYAGCAAGITASKS